MSNESTLYDVVDCNGITVPRHYSGRARTIDEAQKILEQLNKNGEFKPYTIKTSQQLVATTKNMKDYSYLHPFQNKKLVDSLKGATESGFRLALRMKELKIHQAMKDQQHVPTNNHRSKHEENHPKIMHHFLSAEELLDTCMRDEQFIPSIENAAKVMVESLKNGGKIIACGNGGSMSDAMHFAAELTGRLKESRGPIAAVSISDPAHITCVANDYGFDEIFSRYISSIGNKGDVLLAITTSGKSANIQEAVRSAYFKNMSIILLSGNNGGMNHWSYSTLSKIIVPGYHNSGAIQEIHIKVIHALCTIIENELKPK